MSFQGVKDPTLKRQLDQHAGALRPQLPFAQFQYVDVAFTDAGMDVDIPHSLKVTNPNDIRWLVVATDAPITVYRSIS